MTDPVARTLSAEEITTILTEALRRDLNRMVDEQDRGPARTDAEIDAQIERLEQENLALKRAARRGDFTGVVEPLRGAAEAVGLALPATIPNDLGRRAVDLIRELKDIEARALDGEDARTAAAPITARYGAQDVDMFLETETVRLSQAWARALQLHPTKSMKGNIDAIARVAIEFFGDVPVATLSALKQEGFFVWQSRLPKKQGRSHGRNRFTEQARREGRLTEETPRLSKQDEIDIADAEDEAAMEEIRAMTGISDLEKRALLVEKLQPRLTMTTLKRNRDGLNRLFKAARSIGCHDAPTAISYKEVERAIQAAAPDDPLFIRVTKPKLRMPWTEERLAQFLTCPIFTGCSSPHRRWTPGPLIIRDAFYWVPLLLMTVGSRIEELLLLKRRSLRYRNGVHCLVFGFTSEAKGKTEDSERVVPIPQVLLDLGFVDWIKALDDAHGPLLFPEIARRTVTGKVTDVFGKALSRMLKRLDLADFDEDLYAARKTLSSMLRRADVSDGQRQALAGHRAGSILNRHYTAHHTRDLKAAVDRADFKLQIAHSDSHGHPIIKACDLAAQESFSVEVVLAADGLAESIEVRKSGCGEKVFEFDRTALPEPDRSGKAYREAAQAFRKLMGEHPLCLPKNTHKRAAVEHFHALG